VADQKQMDANAMYRGARVRYIPITAAMIAV